MKRSFQKTVAKDYSGIVRIGNEKLGTEYSERISTNVRAKMAEEEVSSIPFMSNILVQPVSNKIHKNILVPKTGENR